ncbi:MAG: transporter substrate-binding domain-containing protein [Syntrophomonas sp.]
MLKKTGSVLVIALIAFSVIICGCSSREKFTSIDQLSDKQFAVPTGTIADQLVLSKYPKAKFQYYNNILDSCMAVKAGKADAAAYDEPILKNIAAKNPGLVVLPEMITVDKYGFAVALNDTELKTAIDDVIKEVKTNGTYDQMMTRWFPKSGSPADMPVINTDGAQGVLKLGTAAVTEPFSFVGSNRQVVGFDIELASYVAQKLDKQLEIVNMDFGALIPALTTGKVDMIGACITINDERSKEVLFSEPYYEGGIAALVKE